ncbi:hypothetical protein JOB18_027575 [Solea senegalensis]|uniref:Uncharacterized protein n=1 Tax=Solea senegalensis TaxID=28829 RepID=A0AAV6PJA4_SOLSE|nr:hypothetical protein JOB18_027575 [Solea senegalensis]
MPTPAPQARPPCEFPANSGANNCGIYIPFQLHLLQQLHPYSSNIDSTSTSEPPASAAANNQNRIDIYSNYTCCNRYNANFNHKIYNHLHRVSDVNSGANNHNGIYIHSNHTCYSNYTANYNSNIHNTSQ